MKQLIIFDLDGTLLNTIDDLGMAANHALAEMGYPTHHISSYPHFVGHGITRLIERVAPRDYREDPQVIAALREKFIEYYDIHCCDLTKPYPGIPELLRHLSVLGVGLAVASNKYQRATETLISRFFPDIPWAAVSGQQEGVPVKPDPSIVFGILAGHPTRKADVLYVGDSAVDMETARRAGVESVGVSWGFRSVAELTEALADHIVNRPEDILKIISNS